MDWNLLTLGVDFGLLILTLLVQLIIYPGFAYVDAQKFKTWHEKYTLRISVVVMPLMLGQVGLYVRRLFSEVKAETLVASLLIVFIWVLTFVWIVPVHERLSKGMDPAAIRKLVALNWGRTIAWGLIVVLNGIGLS